jgi:hypothetical protein
MSRVIKSIRLEVLRIYKRNGCPDVNTHCTVTKPSSIVSPVCTRGCSISLFCSEIAFFCYFYQLISTMPNLCIRVIRKQFMKVFLCTSVAGNWKKSSDQPTNHWNWNLVIKSLPVTVAELAWKPESWVRIPFRAWIFGVCVRACAFFCVGVQVEAFRRAAPAQGILLNV